MRKMDYLLFSRQNDGLGADDAMLQLPDGLEIRVTRIGFGIVRFLKKQISSAELLFSLASFGRCYLYTAVTRDGAVVHKSTVIGKNFKFPFLKRGEYELPINAKGVLELTELVFQEILFEAPSVLLCSPDCPGLCPICGKKKAAGCSCQQAEEAAPADARLSILQQLLN